MQLWRVRRARLQHPGCPCVPLMARGWCAISVPGSARAAQEGCSPHSDGLPQLQTWWWLCVRSPVTPWAGTSCCAEMEPASVRAAGVGGRRRRGRAVHMALPNALPKGQRCVWWVHVWGPKGCWELLSRAISWQCPCSKDMTAPDRVGEGETHWCNPAGPFALGWASWDEQGVEKLTRTMFEGRAS